MVNKPMIMALAKLMKKANYKDFIQISFPFGSLHNFWDALKILAYLSPNMVCDIFF